MARALGRTIDSFLSCIFCYPRHHGSHHNLHHPSSSASTYYYNYYNHNGGRSSSNYMTKGRPLSLQIVELRVRMCCAGCERVVKNAIYKLQGVDSVEVDLPMEKVTVTGYVDRNKVLKEVRRSGKKAEFWPNPDIPLYFTSAANYFRDEESYRNSYNYWRHGYTGDKHGHIPATVRGEDPVSNIFNDDNVNACTIM